MSTDTPTPEPICDQRHAHGRCEVCGLLPEESPTPERVTGCAANICEPHHFVWTWPIEGGSGSIGVCNLCGRVTTGERDAAREQALREEIGKPHAYGVEVLVNAGRPSEYWRLDDEANVRETLEEAEGERDALIDCDYRPEHLRVVAITLPGIARGGAR